MGYRQSCLRLSGESRNPENLAVIVLAMPNRPFAAHGVLPRKDVEPSLMGKQFPTKNEARARPSLRYKDDRISKLSTMIGKYLSVARLDSGLRRKDGLRSTWRSHGSDLRCPFLLRQYQLPEEAGFLHGLVGGGGFSQREGPVNRRLDRAPVQHLHDLPHVLFGPHEHAVDLFLLAE